MVSSSGFAEKGSLVGDGSLAVLVPLVVVGIAAPLEVAVAAGIVAANGCPPTGGFPTLYW